jgi:hypothetical protein
MTIETRSAWTYGHTVELEKNFLPFSENGVDELINTGAYTLQSFAVEVARAMTEVGSQEYSVSLDRSSRLLTVIADSNFELYVTTSSLSNSSVYPLMGFTTDRSGSNSYVGDEASGDIFYPQIPLQSYVDFVDRQKANNVTVNETATGKIEVIKYGDVNFMRCNITFQTDIEQGRDSYIENRQGETELRAFMQYAVTKAPMEFIPDRDDMNTYTDCLLERTSFDSKGTGFELKELYTRGFANWWESGIIEFREIK